MSIKEEVIKELNALEEEELELVADYVAFLRFQARKHWAFSADEKQLASLYAEFDKEDRDLAEEGMMDYVGSLLAEDAR